MIGENDNYVCELIRKDLIDDFITYVKKEQINLKYSIRKSIFETNPYLLYKSTSLIEYAAFFGSFQIFKYLQNEIRLSPSIWLYAIHGKNIDIINLLEQNNIKPDGEKYIGCFKEAVKCHHNDIVNYITKKYTKKNAFFTQFLEYYNIALIQPNSIKKSLFNDLCAYDYYHLVKILFNNNKIDINKEAILTWQFIRIF